MTALGCRSQGVVRVLDYPEMFPVRQTFSRTVVDDVPRRVRDELGTLRLGHVIKPGQRVAISAGSRGISNIATIVTAVADYVKSLSAIPVIIPAMGSHGGATAPGQLAILASLGITPEACGCEIQSSMETVVVCTSPEGVDIHFDRSAYECDHVIVCGRIKPHTDFRGPIQSGLMKMMLIGFGKHRGAALYHRAFRDYSFDQIVRSVATEVMQRCNVVAGLAIVENGYEETALLEAVAPARD